MIKNVEKVIREYLPNVIHLSLATSKENKPWVCELHFVFDEELNLYFRSKAERRHSKELELNENIAGNIVKQHLVGENPRGIYFEGKAEMLKGVDENSLVYKLYCERFGTGKEILDDANSKGGHQFYKISVNKFYIFDAIESSPSTKYELIWNKT